MAQDSRFDGYHLWVCSGVANEDGVLARSTNALIAVLDRKLERHDHSNYIALRVHYSDCRIPVHPVTPLRPALIVMLNVIDHKAFANPSIVKVINFLRIEGRLSRRVIVVTCHHKIPNKRVQIRLGSLLYKLCSGSGGYRRRGQLLRLLLGSLLCNQEVKRFVDRFDGNSKIEILPFDPLEGGNT